MESFLQSTSAHGLSYLISDSRHKKAFWMLVCLGSYIAMIWATVDLYRKFTDPTNLKQRTVVEEVNPLNADGTVMIPVVYPRYILCAQDPSSNLTRYEHIDVMYVTSTSYADNVYRKLPPLELTYFEPMFEKDLGTFGMCSSLPTDALGFLLTWGEVQGSFLLYFSLWPKKEPFINRRMISNKMVHLEVSRRVREVRINFSKMNIFEYYVGALSSHQDSFPHYIDPMPARSYDQNLCMSLISASSDPYEYCIDGYVASAMGQNFNFEKFNCSWLNGQAISYLFCQCSSANPRGVQNIEHNAAHDCKSNALKLKYEFTNETIYQDLSAEEFPPESVVSLADFKIQTTTIKETHAMDVGDLLSQIGGLLGLLVGASIMTLFEVFELLCSFLIKFFKKIVNRSTVVAPENHEVTMQSSLKDASTQIPITGTNIIVGSK